MAPLPAEMCIPAAEITDPHVRPGAGSLWAIVTENLPAAGKSSHVACWSLPVDVWNSEPVRPWSGPEPVPGRGMSGGVCAWSPDGTHLAVITVDGPWWARIDDTNSVVECGPVPVPPGHGWSGPAWSADSARIAVVADWAQVWVWRLGSPGAQPDFSGPDFVMDPTWWQTRPVVHAWSRPDMAWTRSAIAPDVFEEPDAQAQQPRTSPAGSTLGFVTDVGGTLNLRVIGPDARSVDICDEAEVAGPTWGPGQRTWCWSPDARRVAVARNTGGFGVLSVFDLDSGGRVDLARGVHGAVSWQGDVIAALRSGARTPTQLVAYDAPGSSGAKRTVVATADPRWVGASGAVFGDEMVEPDVMTVQGPGGAVPVRLYRAHRPTGRLLCWVHGGPTDQWQVTFMARLVFWLSRGFDIAVVDHRGTTGHGRKFMLALHGAWGRADAEDLCAAAEHLHGLGEHHGAATAFVGASAGGLTALAAAAARPDLVGAVAASYPVIDLAMLAAGDDPFESHYVPTLVGDSLGIHEPVLSRAETLARVPILICHGDADTVVPLGHARRLEAALAPHGGRVDVRVFAGEGHGFRRRENQLAEYEITEAHLGAHLA